MPNHPHLHATVNKIAFHGISYNKKLTEIQLELCLFVRLNPLVTILYASVKPRDVGSMPSLVPFHNEVKSLITVSYLCKSLVSFYAYARLRPIRTEVSGECVLYYVVCYWDFAYKI